MNHDGPWSWRSTKQSKTVDTEDQRAYIERVTRTKKKASNKAARKRRQATRAAIRARNDAPIF